MNVEQIRTIAQAELDAERYRAAVDAAKEVLRNKQAVPWWRRLFPFTIRITITRRNA